MRRIILLSLICAAPASAIAQDDPASQVAAEKEKIVAAKDLIVAEKDLVNARADLDRARVSSLGLPSYEGQTKLEGGAGKLEASVLASGALLAAANKIADDAKSYGKLIILAGDEKLDFTVHESLRTELDAIHQLFNEATPTSDEAMFGPSGVVSAVSAVAGLLRSDRTITAIDLSTALPSRMLVAAVADKLDEAAVVPSAIIMSPPEQRPEPPEWHKKSLAQAFNTLVAEASVAAQDRKKIPEKPNAGQKALGAALDRALTRYKAFYDRVTTPDSSGVVPLVAAIRLSSLANGEKRNVLRVHVEQGGGTLLNLKNISTFFGADPLRVSGAVVVSYVITDPREGTVKASNVFACRSAITTLAKVQSGDWRQSVRADDPSRCD